MRRVWVDDWQMQCCGDAFEIGSTVTWTVVPSDVEFLGTVLGEEEAGRITDAEEHHSEDPDALSSLTGVVRAIGAVHCAYGPSPTGNALYPLPGTSQVVTKQRADGWEIEGGGRRFLGYVVDLDER